MTTIPFNKPFLTGKETEYIEDAVASGKISGDGKYTKLCHEFFENTFLGSKCLLTTSCTDALEMAAILINIEPGDEVIAPSYTFVSTVNAFLLRGANIIFADSSHESPNIDVSVIEALISPKTKAVIAVHYAGIACDMNALKKLCQANNLFLIEDAAQAIDSYYLGRPLGSFGDLAAFSFHETKNIIAGEGGLLVINNDVFKKRAEIIREKGTNRSAFFRGEVDKYNWVDIGSSFLPSDIIAAFLFAQLEKLDLIQAKRKTIWNCYKENLQKLEDSKKIRLPYIPEFASNNAHMFYIICSNIEQRTELINHLKNSSIHAVFHYISLHRSEFYKKFGISNSGSFFWSDYYSDCLLRLPFYYELSKDSVERICGVIHEFYEKR